MLPIPEIMKSNKNEVNEEVSGLEELNEEKNMRKEALYKDKPQKSPNEGGYTSGYYMRNARYKPGVKPLKLKENEF